MKFFQKNTNTPFKKKFLPLFVLGWLVVSGCIKQPVPMVITSSDPIVQKFYTANHTSLFWFSSNKKSKKAVEWLTEIEAAQRFGIVSDQLEIDLIKSTLLKKNWLNNVLKAHDDQQVTGLVLNYLKELQQGNIKFDYDEVSVSRDSVYIYQLLNFKSRESVANIVSRLECKDPDYLVLKKYLTDSITEKDTLKYKSIIRAMNYRKYLTINLQSEYIIVNIPEANALYFMNDKPSIEMRAIAGMRKKPTPTIASYITSVVTFPFWSVPYDIGVTEILPKAQKDENYLEQNNFDVVDNKGNIIADSDLNLKNYNQKSFPYYFRQSTGSENSLGVLKFEMNNPFSIFLHSTSWQGAFTKDFRFLSHGCIRLEKPIELASALLRGKLDIEELKKGKKDTESKILKLPKKIPVFIIYMPVKVVDQKIIFLQDVYGLIK